jgi:hypothetical protein
MCCSSATKKEPPLDRLRFYDRTMKSRKANAVCDFAYVNLLREKVRQVEVEARRLQDFGPPPSARFVPWVMTDQLQLKPNPTLPGRRD